MPLPERPLPERPLPERPSVDQLRKQAKDLRRERGIPLSEAQLAVARRHGFASWTRLRRHLEVVDRHSRYPEESAQTGDVAAFLRRACLTYTDDDAPARRREAADLLAAHPELTRDDPYAAAAAADVPALRRLLGADPQAARREGGPFRWEPLLYLAYARVAAPEADVLAAARLLLDAGADPNAGYLWHGLPSPFTALTGAFGEGELGPQRQPRHPSADALARLLLDAGADPNDGQALYNRMFSTDDSHLELLFAYGLGTGDGGPWRRRLGDALDTPAVMLRKQLRWALNHGLADRVRLLVTHGVDPVAPYGDGRTPAQVALLTGHADLVPVLGGGPAPLEPVDAFVAAALAGDAAAVAATPADVVDAARRARPGLVAWAATLGRPQAVRLLAGAGFDVSALGRTDVPREEPWQTALHHAAQCDDVPLARLLLSLGADPSVRDARFGGTPLDWARHFGSERFLREIPVCDITSE